MISSQLGSCVRFCRPGPFATKVQSRKRFLFPLAFALFLFLFLNVNFFWGQREMLLAQEIEVQVREQPEKAVVQFNGQTVQPTHGTATGIWFYSNSEQSDFSSQLLILGHLTPTPKYRLVAVLNPGDSLSISLGNEKLDFQSPSFETEPKVVELTTTLPLDPVRRPFSFGPTACSPPFHPRVEEALIEHDWRMQDGIDTPLEQRTYTQAVKNILPGIVSLLNDLQEQDLVNKSFILDWKRQLDELGQRTEFSESDWLRIHRLRREMVLRTPEFPTEPLLFAKHVPSTMSHQLTQTYGYTARPGGGLFVLQEPGKTMRLADLTPKQLPIGNFVHPELNDEADRIYFAFCEVAESPKIWRDSNAMNRRYHLYEMKRDGTDLRQLTEGDYDDFSPTVLPDGRLIFISTRRGGFHRCGAGPCYVYTLSTLDPKTSNLESGSTPGLGLSTELGLERATSSHPLLETGQEQGGVCPQTQVLSFHETNEWDPAVLNDGRVIYTRWDYVDRDAVFYQQLWTVRQDGTNVRIFYGNNTFVPCGVWEAKPIPNSGKILATAGPHHGMTAGSIIMIDPSLGVDGAAPIRRMTPDVRFPEGETLLAAGIALPEPSDFDSPVPFYWDAVNRPDRPAEREKEVPEQEKRWTGHCYKSAYPLSEKSFLVSYSYDQLRGELGPNIPNMFGLYYVDVFGNKELLYRDPNISSVWAKPIRPRISPPLLTSHLERVPLETVEKGEMSRISQTDSTRETDGISEGEGATGTKEFVETTRKKTSLTGTFYLQNVYESWPQLPIDEENRITALRIVQVLPKTTPNANDPMIGAAFASPGKQVLGTVPVEKDGSAYFECPAETPILFQALDARGRAVQIMRSLTYLQPGENASCIGCHENRMLTFSGGQPTLAISRVPSRITPGPDGSQPFSFPILMQPVLDQHCVSCHSTEQSVEKSGGIFLTGEPDGHYTRSYQSLIPYVAYTAWTMPNGNYEPYSEPGRFGARASKLVEQLDRGHHDVVLSEQDWNRLNTWIDANALFYGTFNPTEQAKQQRGERIAGPDLE
ncbi:MAG: hypothetical protein ACRC10_01450 [Thermoguttaceae bacterium]